MDLFNTSTVSVESTWERIMYYDILLFQYFNCIGGIHNRPWRFCSYCKVSILQLYRWNDLAKKRIRSLAEFQYFNCIGGMTILIMAEQKMYIVSILQLYRWNKKTTHINYLSSKVSILQLYRWNELKGKYLQNLTEEFQYFNCIGGITLL